MISKLYRSIMVILSLSGLLLIYTSVVAQAEDFRFYIIEETSSGEPYDTLPRRSSKDDLFVSYRGEEILITNETLREARYKGIFAEIDLDLDGHKELILEIHNGGNCCGTGYAIVSYRGENFFSVTEHELLHGVLFPNLKIIPHEGNPILKVRNLFSLGADNVSQEERIVLMQYNYGNLEVISESVNAAVLPTLLEVNSYEFDQDKTEEIVKIFDADGDDTPDKLICNYWSRWGSAVCDVESSVNGYLDMSLGCSRFGVLSSETNGMKDLVCNKFSKLIFDGEKYQEDE